MKLRDHPSTKWPPTWTRIDGDGDIDVTGEIGTLKGASTSRVQPKTCYLIVDVGASFYMGRLVCDNAAACRQVLALLQRQIGCSIKQIGDLELG
jgi:hypothetical protein